MVSGWSIHCCYPLSSGKFPTENVTKLVILGTLLSTDGGEATDKEPDWVPPWWEPWAIGLSDI